MAGLFGVWTWSRSPSFARVWHMLGVDSKQKAQYGAWFRRLCDVFTGTARRSQQQACRGTIEKITNKENMLSLFFFLKRSPKNYFLFPSSAFPFRTSYSFLTLYECRDLLSMKFLLEEDLLHWRNHGWVEIARISYRTIHHTSTVFCRIQKLI